ncbi:hypothetical protein HC891_22665, partial [Candidatus Gracilibacteria bacterium]|nr:hypothetical protein [Candidatus Gracilibacteria bacterium]
MDTTVGRRGSRRSRPRRSSPSPKAAARIAAMSIRAAARPGGPEGAQRGLKQASGGGADVIYDAVGGDYAEPALRAINWEGRYLVIGFPAGIPKIPL